MVETPQTFQLALYPWLYDFEYQNAYFLIYYIVHEKA